jgi:hypothetical protein
MDMRLNANPDLGTDRHVGYVTSCATLRQKQGADMNRTLDRCVLCGMAGMADKHASPETSMTEGGSSSGPAGRTHSGSTSPDASHAEPSHEEPQDETTGLYRETLTR